MSQGDRITVSSLATPQPKALVLVVVGDTGSEWLVTVLVRCHRQSLQNMQQNLLLCGRKISVLTYCKQM